MTEAALMAAVPGQSLTDYPKNYPWERPPEMTDPNEAIKFHIDRIADEDVIDNVLDLLEFGIPAKTLAKSCLLYTSPSPRDGLLSRMPSSA